MNKDIEDFFGCLQYLLKKLPYNFEVKISKNGFCWKPIFSKASCGSHDFSGTNGPDLIKFTGLM